MISARDIVVRYRAGSSVFTALNSVSLDIKAGEYIAILGPNGSGKSTLLKALCGLIAVESGRVLLFGKEVKPGSFSDELFGRVGIVFQEPEGQFVMRHVRIEIESVLQNLGISLEEQQRRFAQIVEQFALWDILDRKPEKLSGGQMQAVNLACAIASGARVLLLDEPTTFLDQSWRARFLALLDKLHGDGFTILHITQYPDEAIRARRLYFIDQGRLTFDGPPDALYEDDDLVIKHRLTLPFSKQFAKVFGFGVSDFGEVEAFIRNLSCDRRSLNESRNAGAPLVEVSNMQFEYGPGGFNIEIEKLVLHPDSVVGLVGTTGSGKSTLAFLLAGLLRPDGGSVILGGRRVGDYSARELRQMVGLSWQIADLALIGPTIDDDVRFGLENHAIDVQGILESVGLGGFEHRIVDTLSGGEKRKLSLANILALQPGLLILDEPSAFLDPDSQAELIEIIRNIARQGNAVVIIGHDLRFISELADRILGMRDGRICLDVPARRFFSDPGLLESLGLPPDPIVVFRKLLGEHGAELPEGTLNPGKIAEQLRTAGPN